MKITVNQRWRLRPLSSFFGFMDLKMGVTVALLFALLNKVAGFYGLIAVFTGGSFAQVSMYVYSILALFGLGWGLQAVSQEDPKRTLYFAHLFFADHVISTAWTIFFAVVWWIYTPHDGRRQANSAAQEELLKSGAGHNMTDEQRVQEAMLIWNKEKGFAAAVLVIGWLFKIYFAVLIYSYAYLLRKGTYRSPSNRAGSPAGQYIPLSRQDYPDASLDEEDGETDVFYRAHKSPFSAFSISSFADFVNAPSPRRSERRTQPKSNIVPNGGLNGYVQGNGLGFSTLVGSSGLRDAEQEVLFDSEQYGLETPTNDLYSPREEQYQTRDRNRSKSNT